VTLLVLFRAISFKQLKERKNAPVKHSFMSNDKKHAAEKANPNQNSNPDEICEFITCTKAK